MARVFRERTFKVCFDSDNMGGISFYPVSDAIAARYAAHMRTMGEPESAAGYIQSGADELAGIIPARKLRELADGYRVVCLLDPYTFGCLLGYDASEVDPFGRVEQ